MTSDDCALLSLGFVDVGPAPSGPLDSYSPVVSPRIDVREPTLCAPLPMPFRMNAYLLSAAAFWMLEMLTVEWKAKTASAASAANEIAATGPLTRRMPRNPATPAPSARDTSAPLEPVLTIAANNMQ